MVIFMCKKVRMLNYGLRTLGKHVVAAGVVGKLYKKKPLMKRLGAPWSERKAPLCRTDPLTEKVYIYCPRKLRELGLLIAQKAQLGCFVVTNLLPRD